MPEEYNQLSEEEKIKAENDFLKMKIMAEHGGQFYSPEHLPAEIENGFLNHIIEFERQFSDRKTITVFEKIGSPEQFKSEKEIPDVDIEQAWDELSDYMSNYGIELSACSPKVTVRELYRFAIEELFKHETDDITIPGMMTGFIYDEFHPDPEYDNQQSAKYNCLQPIFCKEPFEWVHDFAKQLRFNDHEALARDEFKDLINRFKDLHDEIELDDLAVESSDLTDGLCIVKGMYTANTKVGTDNTGYKGNWAIEFIFDEEIGFWQINNVQIEGLAL